MTSRISTLIEPWMEAAIESHGQGEKILWEVTFLPMTTNPNQPPELVFHIMVWIPSTDLGQMAMGICPYEQPWTLTEEVVDDLMSGLLRHMREMRSQSLSQTHSGLVLP